MTLVGHPWMVGNRVTDTEEPRLIGKSLYKLNIKTSIFNTSFVAVPVPSMLPLIGQTKLELATATSGLAEESLLICSTV